MAPTRERGPYRRVDRSLQMQCPSILIVQLYIHPNLATFLSFPYTRFCSGSV